MGPSPHGHAFTLFIKRHLLGSSTTDLHWDTGTARLALQDIAFGVSTSILILPILLMKAKHCISSR